MHYTYTTPHVGNKNLARRNIIRYTFRSLDSVSSGMLESFTEVAEKLIEERGAVSAVAAALAVISGSTELKKRSLLNAREVSKSRVNMSSYRGFSKFPPLNSVCRFIFASPYSPSSFWYDCISDFIHLHDLIKRFGGIIFIINQFRHPSLILQLI